MFAQDLGQSGTRVSPQSVAGILEPGLCVEHGQSSASTWDQGCVCNLGPGSHLHLPSRPSITLRAAFESCSKMQGGPAPGSWHFFLLWKSPLALVLILFKTPNLTERLHQGAATQSQGAAEKMRAGAWTIPCNPIKEPQCPDLHKSQSRLGEHSEQEPGRSQQSRHPPSP